MNKTPQLVFRILIVEDDPKRARVLESWLPQGAKVVVATSAGKALGLLQRDRGRVYAGVLLDYNLEKQAATESDLLLSGSHVVDAVIRHVSNDVPVLVHSMNASQAPAMVGKLEHAGFLVTRIPMEELTKGKLADWLKDVREIWEELQEV